MPNDCDIDKIVSNLKYRPETCDTILGKCDYNQRTQHEILKRKLNRLCEFGDILKFAIPGTRGGKVLYHKEPKEYRILVEVTGIRGSATYYFKDFKKIKQKVIEVEMCWKLKEDNWEEQEKRIFTEANVLLFI